MPDQPPSDRSTPAERFKTEMPQIPGVSAPASPPPETSGSSLKLVIGLIVVLAVVFLGARWALHPHPANTKSAEQPQIEVPSPAPDPSTLVPHASDDAPGIATTEEMAKPWSSKEFFVRNGLTGENMPAVLVRLPTGSSSRPTGYWAFSVNAPYGNCRLEYITDLTRLQNDYGFAGAKHPMVGNPCSHTVFDPVKTATLPGTGAIVRGAIVQGSDLRPPMGVEIRVHGKEIEAVRAE